MGEGPLAMRALRPGPGSGLVRQPSRKAADHIQELSGRNPDPAVSEQQPRQTAPQPNGHSHRGQATDHRQHQPVRDSSVMSRTSHRRQPFPTTVRIPVSVLVNPDSTRER